MRGLGPQMATMATNNSRISTHIVRPIVGNRLLDVTLAIYNVVLFLLVRLVTYNSNYD